MISIGHRAGLFDKMAEVAEPLTSGELAEATGLSERYVREWLSAMVTAGIVDHDDDTEKFSLPAEHSAFLTRNAGVNNLAVFTQYFSVLGTVEDDILECFRHGGGVPYSKYPRFHEVMAEESGQSVLSSLDSHIIPLIPGLADKLADGINVLDLGCGSGRIMCELARTYPNSRFVGIDLSNEAVSNARREAESLGLQNIEFIERDITNLDQDGPVEEFDLVTTFDAIHDQARPLNVLKGIFRALKNDGNYLMQDINGTGDLSKDKEHPIGTLLYTISCMHCMTVSLAQGGEGVGAMWGEKMTRDYLANAGFSSVETHKIEHDIQNNWYVVRK